MTALLIPVTPSRLPVNLVNPPRKRWDVVNLDTVRYTRGRFGRISPATFRAKRYRKVPNLVNAHSWMPVAFNPFAAVDEHVIDLNLGLTLLSQNLLSNTEAYASYGWNRQRRLAREPRACATSDWACASTWTPPTAATSSSIRWPATTADRAIRSTRSRPAPDKYYSVGLSATLPLYFQRGYHTRQLSVSAGWNYSNGMVADLRQDRMGERAASPTSSASVSARDCTNSRSELGFSDQVRMAHRDIAPRWGYTLSTNYTFNPANAHFSDLISFYGQAYLPGFAPHNSVKVAATYQTSIGGYKFPSGYAPLSYKSTRLIPARVHLGGHRVEQLHGRVRLDYQLPVWYPEGGIGSVIYIKRIRLNAGGDYAQFRDVGRGGMTWRRIWSVGGDIVFDFNAFRQPASATSTFKLSVLPSVEQRGRTGGPRPWGCRSEGFVINFVSLVANFRPMAQRKKAGVSPKTIKWIWDAVFAPFALRGADAGAHGLAACSAACPRSRSWRIPAATSPRRSTPRTAR